MSTSTFKGSEVARTRSAVAVAARTGTPEQVTEARRSHAAAVLAAHITKVVDEAPPFRPEQVDRLTVLLRGGGASA